jgi:carboxyl-terminal processing protease
MKIIKYVIFIAILINANLVNAKTPSTIKIPTSELQRFANVVATVHHYYVEPVTNRQLFDDAISGMLAKLDPHSAYLDKEDLKNLKIVTSGAFDGIGITIVPELGVLRVISPIDDSPAEKAGVKAGDLIVRVNDILIKDMPMSKVIAMIRGKRGTKVTLYIIRKDQPKLLKIVVKRTTIKVPTVKQELLDNYYGYIRIAIFYKTTQRDLIKAIKQLKKESKNKLRGIIIDLRNNPGGLFKPSIQVADDFLDARKLTDNKLIVYTKGYPDDKVDNFAAGSGELLPNIPIIALINAGSASAAEIVAGALQDHDRAVILGTKSFGKGSVQTVIPIDKNSAIKLTTALYYTPSGTSIQAKGIKPDVVVRDMKVTKEEADALPFGSIYEADLLNHIENGDIKELDAKQIKTDGSLLERDFQLYTALNLLKGLSALQ